MTVNKVVWEQWIVTQLRHPNHCKLFRQHYSVCGLWTTAVRHQKLVHEQSHLEDKKNAHLSPHCWQRCMSAGRQSQSQLLDAARDCLQVQTAPFRACEMVQDFCFKGAPLEKAEKCWRSQPAGTWRCLPLGYNRLLFKILNLVPLELTRSDFKENNFRCYLDST